MLIILKVFKTVKNTWALIHKKYRNDRRISDNAIPKFHFAHDMKTCLWTGLIIQYQGTILMCKKDYMPLLQYIYMFRSYVSKAIIHWCNKQYVSCDVSLSQNKYAPT